MPVAAIKAENAVESLRDVVQDLLVPELKAIRADLDSYRRETKLEIEGLRTEMRLRDEKQTQALQALSDKVGYALDIRERLAVLEDRAKRA